LKRYLAGTGTDTEELKRELDVVESKVREFREYLLKLELLRREGKVTDKVYQELKNMYSKELEKYENELKRIREELEKFEVQKL